MCAVFFLFFYVKMMTRQAEAAPLAQITPGSVRVELLHVGRDAFYEKFKTIFSNFGESTVTLAGCNIGRQTLSNLVQLITAVTQARQHRQVKVFS